MMNKTLGTLILGFLSVSSLHAAELPFTGHYRDVHPYMVTELFLLSDQRFCQRLRIPPTDLAISGRWESTFINGDHHITLLPESPHPGPFVLLATDNDPTSAKAAPAGRRITVDGESLASNGENNTVLFGWSKRPVLPDNLAPLFVPGHPGIIGDFLELELPHNARYLFFAHGSDTDGYRISRFDTGNKPYLWLRLQATELLRLAPTNTVFRHDGLQMWEKDFGAPAPVSADMLRHLERDCLGQWPADLPPPIAPETEEFRARLPVKKQPWIKARHP